MQMNASTFDKHSALQKMAHSRLAMSIYLQSANMFMALGRHKGEGDEWTGTRGAARKGEEGG